VYILPVKFLIYSISGLLHTVSIFLYTYAKIHIFFTLGCYFLIFMCSCIKLQNNSHKKERNLKFAKDMCMSLFYMTFQWRKKDKLVQVLFLYFLKFQLLG